MMACWVVMALFGQKRAAIPPSPQGGGSKRHARVTAINSCFDDSRVSDNIGHFRTFQVNPHNWLSADLLLALRHRLEVREELPVRYSTADRTMYPNVGHGSQGDAGDRNLDGYFLTAPACVDGGDWLGHGLLTAKPPTSPEMAASSACSR